MKNKIILSIMALGLALPVVNLKAQDAPDQPEPPKRERLQRTDEDRGDRLERRFQPERRDSDDRDQAERPMRREGPGRGERADQGRGDRPDRMGRPGSGERAERPMPPGAGPRRPGQPRPPVPPLFAALDANHDGVLNREEIAHARRALRKLDRNRDGEITPQELRGAPGFPPRMGRRNDDRHEEHPHPHRPEHRGNAPRD